MPTSKPRWCEVVGTVLRYDKDEFGQRVVIFSIGDDHDMLIQVHKSAVFTESPASIIQRQAERIAELEVALRPIAKFMAFESGAHQGQYWDEDKALELSCLVPSPHLAKRVEAELSWGDLRHAAKVLETAADARGGDDGQEYA